MNTQARGAWLCALVVSLSAAAVRAQDPQPIAAEPSAPAAAQTATVTAPAPGASPDTDIANEIVALRAELDALKTKQEEAEATALLSQGEEPAT
ncbi:MAG: hypothetical protein RL701_1679, partial [Pseudomonadota bacterium]